MNVQIDYEGNDVSNYTVNYKWERKICTGIAMLEITFTYEFPYDIKPWDNIDIYEDGDLKGIFYVSSYGLEAPSGNFLVTCQDNSKRLTDYFIAESYLIDYPSNSGYWIAKFLDDCGVEYEFTENTYGTLLSNNTSLGMVTAYEQIIQLLQMSGWYIKFVDDKAIIGKLTTGSSPVDSFDKTEILSIKTNKTDKMLRNRAVVWGVGNETTSSWVFADRSIITKWNYDSNDLRAIVISNSNIPNNSTAERIAGQLLTEFARIVIEKYLDVAGSRDVDVGDFVRVSSDVFSGTGMITTVGSTMSEAGLITNLILDERCPRLFAFFDYGEYVYVSTFGSGVWRKHLQYDHTWYTYSSGLSNMEIVDLYKNEGVLSCVDSAGGAYVSDETEETWEPIGITGLMYDPTFGNVSGYSPTTVYSGEYYTRATIQDRTSNNVRLAVDNYPSGNSWPYDMYFGEPPASALQASGVNFKWSANPISGYVAWVVDVPAAGGMISYPVTVSGNYNYVVVDIENDGTNDFIAVATTGVSIDYGGQLEFGVSDNIIAHDPDIYSDFGFVIVEASNIYAQRYFRILKLNNHITAVASTGTVGFVYPVTIPKIVFDNYDNRGYAMIRGTSPPILVAGYLDLGLTKFESKFEVPLTGMKTVLAITQFSKYVFNVFGTDTDNKYTGTLFLQVDVSTGSAFSYPGEDLLTPEDGYTRYGWYLLTHHIYNGTLYGIRLDKPDDGSYTSISCTILKITPNTHTVTKATSTIPPRVDSEESWSKIWAANVGSPSSPAGNDNLFYVVYDPSTRTPCFCFLSGRQAFDLEGNLEKVSTTWISVSAAGTATIISDAQAAIPDPEEHPGGYTITREAEIQASTTVKIEVRSFCKVATGDWSNEQEALDGFPGEYKDLQSLGLNSLVAFRRDFNYALGYGTAGGKYYMLDLEGGNILGECAFQPYIIAGRHDRLIYSWQVVPKPGGGNTSGLVFMTEQGQLHHYLPVCLDGYYTSLAGLRANFILANAASYTMVYYIVNQIYHLAYQILRRDAGDFHVVHESTAFDRIDISYHYPEIAIESGISSTIVLLNNVGAVTNVYSPQITLIEDGAFVEDFRYANLDFSGTGASKYLVYAVASGINVIEIDSSGELLAAATTGIFVPPSGQITRVETSNLQSPWQYLFTTVSGGNGGLGTFWQCDPDASGIWVEYPSGYPASSIATRIRLDDRY